MQVDSLHTAATLFGDSVLERYTSKNASKKKQRGEIYRAFMSKVNPTREALNFSKLTEARMGFIFRGIEDADLQTLYDKWDKEKDFVGAFNGRFFPKPKQ